jgi:hypothetical protein
LLPTRSVDNRRHFVLVQHQLVLPGSKLLPVVCGTRRHPTSTERQPTNQYHSACRRIRRRWNVPSFTDFSDGTASPSTTSITQRRPTMRHFKATPVITNHVVEQKPLSLARMYRYLQLETFSESEMELVFDRIYERYMKPSIHGSSSQDENDGLCHDDDDNLNESNPCIDQKAIHNFLLDRIKELERESDANSFTTDSGDDDVVEQARREYAHCQAPAAVIVVGKVRW